MGLQVTMSILVLVYPLDRTRQPYQLLKNFWDELRISIDFHLMMLHEIIEIAALSPGKHEVFFAQMTEYCEDLDNISMRAAEFFERLCLSFPISVGAGLCVVGIDLRIQLLDSNVTRRLNTPSQS